MTENSEKFKSKILDMGYMSPISICVNNKLCQDEQKKLRWKSFSSTCFETSYMYLAVGGSYFLQNSR